MPVSAPDSYLIRPDPHDPRLTERVSGIDHTGARIGDPKKGFAHAKLIAEDLARKAGQPIDLSDVTMHTLKHTAITWALQAGASVWDAAGYFSTSPETIQRVYGHHSPDHQRSAVEAIERRGRK